MPSNATQVDFARAGPVSVGSSFTCAPRLNEMPQLQPVVVTGVDGGFLLGPAATEEGVPGLIGPFSTEQG